MNKTISPRQAIGLLEAETKSARKAGTSCVLSRQDVRNIINLIKRMDSKNRKRLCENAILQDRLSKAMEF